MKIERAKTHLADLKSQIVAFCGRQPYSIIEDQDSEPGKLHFRVKINECIPAVWSVVIGDTIHNLRSALDLLATALVVANRGNEKGAYFPFAKIPSDFEGQLNRKMRDASPAAKKFARRLKPYPGGNKALWMLHCLDLLDKHRAIIPVGAANTGVDPDMAHNIPAGAEFDMLREMFRKVQISLRPADRQFPVQDGAILYTCPAPKPGEPKPNPQFKIEVAFGKDQVADGEPVIKTLQDLIKLVERIANIANRRLF